MGIEKKRRRWRSRREGAERLGNGVRRRRTRKRRNSTRVKRRRKWRSSRMKHE